MNSRRRDILLIDDQPLLLRVTQMQLAEHHEVRVATSLAAARAAIAARLPEVIVCDYMVGDDSGLELIEDMANEHPEVRRILLSGYGPETWQSMVDEGLLHGVLLKPFSLQDLLALVGRE